VYEFTYLTFCRAILPIVRVSLSIVSCDLRWHALLLHSSECAAPTGGVLSVRRTWKLQPATTEMAGWVSPRGTALWQYPDVVFYPYRGPSCCPTFAR
jgi:hypothetical protein